MGACRLLAVGRQVCDGRFASRGTNLGKSSTYLRFFTKRILKPVSIDALDMILARLVGLPANNVPNKCLELKDGGRPKRGKIRRAELTDWLRGRASGSFSGGTV